MRVGSWSALKKEVEKERQSKYINEYFLFFMIFFVYFSQRQSLFFRRRRLLLYEFPKIGFKCMAFHMHTHTHSNTFFASFQDTIFVFFALSKPKIKIHNQIWCLSTLSQKCPYTRTHARSLTNFHIHIHTKRTKKIHYYMHLLGFFWFK